LTLSNRQRHRPPRTGEVHLWTIAREGSASLEELRALLSPEEIARANRLLVSQRRDAFIYYRSMLRRILADYAGIRADEVPLKTTPEGKPVWREPVAGVPLSFNLSHRDDLAVLAVSSGRCVGVDLEFQSASANYDALARQALSPCEWAMYDRLPAVERGPALLRAWTRKEALLKAIGCGLARPLASVEVTFLAHDPPQVVATGDPTEADESWWLESWSPRAGWFAAVAAPKERPALQVEHFSATLLRDRYASPVEPATAPLGCAVS